MYKIENVINKDIKDKRTCYGIQMYSLAILINYFLEENELSRVFSVLVTHLYDDEYTLLAVVY